jgi:hypothetical protein
MSTRSPLPLAAASGPSTPTSPIRPISETPVSRTATAAPASGVAHGRVGETGRVAPVCVAGRVVPPRSRDGREKASSRRCANGASARVREGCRQATSLTGPHSAPAATAAHICSTAAATPAREHAGACSGATEPLSRQRPDHRRPPHVRLASVASPVAWSSSCALGPNGQGSRSLRRQGAGDPARDTSFPRRSRRGQLVVFGSVHASSPIRTPGGRDKCACAATVPATNQTGGGCRARRQWFDD